VYAVDLGAIGGLTALTSRAASRSFISWLSLQLSAPNNFPIKSPAMIHVVTAEVRRASFRYQLTSSRNEGQVYHIFNIINSYKITN
jgi:hypothetical protein